MGGFDLSQLFGALGGGVPGYGQGDLGSGLTGSMRPPSFQQPFNLNSLLSNPMFQIGLQMMLNKPQPGQRPMASIGNSALNGLLNAGLFGRRY